VLSLLWRIAGTDFMSELTTTAQPPLRSEFAADADFHDLLDLFVSAVPDRMRVLSELHRARCVEELGRQAHQLKGAGGGYGFPLISEAGAELQHACRRQDTVRIEHALNELISLLARVEL
jgi:HPt (histidine-containing phosphotransfer) domain-containing protein